MQADRWAKENKNLKGDQLKAAVDKQLWDDSVKSLIATPKRQEQGKQIIAIEPTDPNTVRVMTFIVSHAGDVFQKNPGPATARLAERMTSYNPDKLWQKVSETAPVK